MNMDKWEMLDALERSHRRPCLWGLAGVFPKPGRQGRLPLHACAFHPYLSVKSGDNFSV